MEQKINVAELLKDCPKGMELDCTNYDGIVTFEEIYSNSTYPIQIKIKHEGKENTLTLTKYGQTCLTPYNKCVIFPKGKRTWEGFQKPFKDGDILAYDISSTKTTIFIYRYDNPRWNTSYFVALSGYTNNLITDAKGALRGYEYNVRFATQEETERLFKAITSNGYKWNPETKTLEKLCPFNPGDVLVSSAGNIVLFSHIDDRQVIYYHCILDHWNCFSIAKETSCGVGLINNCKLATYEQRNQLFDRLQKSGYKYNIQTNKLEKLIEPNFKVGDRIRNTRSNSVGVIEKLTDTGYDCRFDYGYFFISFKDQHNFILVPNKFDLTTLKLFDKVLVRLYDTNLWKPATFGFFKDNHFYVSGGNVFLQCIPYEGNEHLLGTTNNCAEYYKTWE